MWYRTATRMFRTRPGGNGGKEWKSKDGSTNVKLKKKKEKKRKASSRSRVPVGESRLYTKHLEWAMQTRLLVRRRPAWRPE